MTARKYQGGTTHRLALLHAIGQMQIINGGAVALADILPFMRVSKPTAIKALKEMAFERDELIMTKIEGSGKFGRWEFYLHDDMYEEFRDNIYMPYFEAYIKGLWL